jgi:hypothetical protein
MQTLNLLFIVTHTAIVRITADGDDDVPNGISYL